MKPPILKIPFTTDIGYLDPRMAKDIPEFMRKIAYADLNIRITCTARLMRCQVALYAQGRQSVTEINRLRQLARMNAIGAVEAKKIITWTLFSKHLVNYDDTDPNNDYSQAFDFVVLSGKQAIWDVKASVNKNKIPDYEEVGEIAESFGWEWGGRWKKSPDYPHIQLRA
jgi:peptidoglycan L-alanyl-D-glutamate endopeptidase CwlK